MTVDHHLQKKQNDDAKILLTKPPVQGNSAGDPAKDCREGNPDLANPLQPNALNSSPVGEPNQPGDAQQDATELFSVIQSVPQPGSPKKDNSTASTVLLSISKQFSAKPKRSGQTSTAQEEQQTQGSCQMEQGSSANRRKGKARATRSSKSRKSKEEDREQDRTQKTESEHNILQQEVPASDGTIRLEKTPPSAAPSLNISQAGGSSEDVQMRERTSKRDVTPKVCVTQDNSVTLSQESERKESPTPSSSKRSPKTALITELGRGNKQRLLKKGRYWKQIANKPSAEKVKSGKESDGQGSNEEALQIREKESAKLNMSAEVSKSARNKRKSKEEEIKEQGSGAKDSSVGSSRSARSRQKKAKVEAASESESGAARRSAETGENCKERNKQPEAEAPSSEPFRENFFSSENGKAIERNEQAASSSNAVQMMNANLKTRDWDAIKMSDGLVRPDSNNREMKDGQRNDSVSGITQAGEVTGLSSQSTADSADAVQEKTSGEKVPASSPK
ncbi:unnamed protein product [Toxocara canis]|uniref:RING-type domain-containing protein n=1 Tax=Toxocara canis TaxID=6265 RepID=A0A183UQB4_TOXCA|nr:unnamed protein product [Toxocara canis]